MRLKRLVALLVGTIVLAIPAIADEPLVFLLNWSTAVGPGSHDPRGIGVDADGNVFVTDVSQDAVLKFSGNGTFLQEIGSNGSGNGQFANPIDVGIDASGTMYVTDASNGRIEVLDANGNYLRQWAAKANGWLALDPNGQFLCTKSIDSIFVYSTSDGARLAGWQFRDPSIPSGESGFAVGPSGMIYVPMSRDNKVRIYAPTGALLGEWGTPGIGPGQLQGPGILTVDSNERVYVADQGCRVQKFTATGGFLASWGSCGTGDGEIASMSDLAVDAFGNVFTLEDGQYRVQKWGDIATKVVRQTWGGLKLRFR
jgi:tripartite motif-containing protein 71